MNPKTTGYLLTIALGVFALIYFVERPWRQAAQQPRSTRLFPGFIPANVQSIQVRPTGQVEIRAERDGARWQLSRPITYPAHAERIDALLGFLENLDWRAHVTASDLKDRPLAQEEFGFAPPRGSIVIQQKDGATRHLLVGANTAVGDEVYVQDVGGDGFYVVDARFLGWLPGSIEEWRDPGVIDLADLPVSALRVRAGARSFELELDPPSQVWRMTKPIPSRADNAKIEQLLGSLQELRIARFVSDDPNADLEKFGLHAPEIELTFLQGTNLLAGLQFGTSPPDDPTHVFAKRQRRAAVFLVPKQALEAWRGTHQDFRERRLVSLPAEDVAVIEVRGAEAFTLQRQADGSWRAAETPGSSVDALLVSELLAFMNETEVEFEKSVVTEGDWASFGLAPPSLHYTLKRAPGTGARGEAVAAIDFGRDEAGKAFARYTNETSVLSLKPHQLERLPREVWQFRNRRVWTFASSNVLSVTIEQKGQTRKLERQRDMGWGIAPGTLGSLDPFLFEKVDEALHRIGELEVASWVARGERNEERFGFAETDHRIRIEVKRGEKVETLDLEFGRPSGFFHAYAAVDLDGELTVFEFPWALYYGVVAESLSIRPVKKVGR